VEASALSPPGLSDFLDALLGPPTLYDDRPNDRANSEALILRALRRVAAAELHEKLDTASRQSWALGKVFNKDGYPGEREVLAALGGAVWRATRMEKAVIASTLRQAFATGQAAATKASHGI
jgi:hypothetical protein